MNTNNSLVRSGPGIVNTDREAYQQAVAKRKQDKYIQDMEMRISKLESALQLLETTFKETKK